MHRAIMMHSRDSKIEDVLIEEMGTSLSWICMGVLEGKTEEFGFKQKKLSNLFDYVQAEKKKWQSDEISTDRILEEAKGKRGHIYEACKAVPFYQLLNLTDPKRHRMSTDPQIKRYLQCGYMIIGVWLDTVLQEHYRMSAEDRRKIFGYINDWIDSYQRGYLSNKGINEMFIEDIGYNMATGEKV